MEKIGIKIKKLDDGAKLPFYATDGAAACDFYSVEDVFLEPGRTAKIKTGIAVEIPSEFYLKIEGRSGLASKGIQPLGGVVDSDYRGEIMVMLHNLGNEKYEIKKGERIAQGIFIKFAPASFEEVNELSETKRGAGGFQSTGKN